ncbi:MAG: transposase [Treponema sp.]|nr:transposase [Treponema sp.]
MMPTHIHLLITPGDGGDLTRIMHWIKTHSAKRWNRIHGSTDHMWGARYFARPIKDPGDYFFVMSISTKIPLKPVWRRLWGNGKLRGRIISGIIFPVWLTIPILPACHIPGCYRLRRNSACHR